MVRKGPSGGIGGLVNRKGRKSFLLKLPYCVPPMIIGPQGNP